MDISLIKEKLAEHGYDTERTIGYFIGEHKDSDGEEDFNNDAQRARGAKNSTAMSKKMEKKMRQMERQRLKVIEQQSEKQAKQNKSPQAAPVPVAAYDGNQEDMNISISNIQTKSI